MKNLIKAVLLLLFAWNTNAQQTGTRYNDTIASPPTPPPPSQLNRSNKVESVKMQSTGEIDAEKEAKDKGSTQNQTQVNPEKIAPIVADTVKRQIKVRRR